MRTFTESSPTPDNSSSAASGPGVPAQAGRWKRLPRWLRRAFGVLAALLILIAAAPYVVAPIWGPDIVAAIGDSQIKGVLRIERVSLSWFSPIELEGVRLAHPDGTTVLEVASVHLDAGLLAATVHAEKFGRIEIRHPHVRLERGRSGQFTLAEALASARPSQPHEDKKGKKPAQPAGRLVVIDGEVDFRRPDAPPVLTTGLNLDCTLDTLSNIHARFSGTVRPSASFVGEVSVAGLMPGGKIDLDAAVATATLYTGAPVDLAAVFDGAGVSGLAEAKADARMENGRVHTVVAVGLTGLAAAKGSQIPPRPVNLAVRCEASTGPGESTALAQMQGDVGDLKVNFAYRRGDTPVGFRLGEHVEALLQGNALPMPDVTADAAGGFDFARLAGAIPALANLRPDAKIEQCTLEFQGLHFQGGPKPALKGRILLPTLRAHVAGSLVQWDAAEADLAVWTDPTGRIRIDKAQFQLGGELLQLQASGDADDLTLKARADVAKLYARLGEVFRMEGFTATGQFDLTARLRRPPVDAQAPTGQVHVALEAAANARQIAFRKAGRPVDAFALTGALAWKADLAKTSDTFTAQGDLTLADGALTLAGEEVKLDRLAFGHDVSYNRTRRDLKLQKARLTSPALNLDATGELRNLGQTPLINVTGQYSADWNVLTPLLHQFDDRTPDSFAALKDTAGKFTFTRGADGVAASFEFAGALGKLNFLFNAPRLNALQSIDAAAFLAAAAAGEPVPALPEAHVKLAGVLDLAVLFQATPPGAIQATHPHPCAGTLEFRDVVCTLGEKPALGGAIALTGVSVLFQGRTSAVGDVLLDLSAVTDADGHFKADKIALTAPGLTLNASGTPTAVTLDVAADFSRVGELYLPWLGRKEVLQGRFNAKGTLARQDISRKSLQANLTARFDRAGFVPSATPTPASEPTELTATLAYKGRVDWSEGLASTGTLLASDVLFQAPGIRQQQQRMTAVHDFQIDKPRERLQLKRLDISFQPAWFSINAAGEITQLQTRRLMDIKGKYTGDWDEICRVIRAFKPDVPIPTKFLFSGTTEGLFTVTGPMEHPAILANYRDMSADAGFGWTTARTMGLELGQAKFRPTMKDGIMTLPLTEVAASGGMARLAANVDVRGERAVLSLPPNLQVLQQVRLTEQFTHEMLSRANPVFAGLGSIQGTLSLRMTNLRVPLDDTAKTQATGAGRLDLTDVRFRPTGLLGQLLALAGVAGTQELTLQPTGVDFRIARGGIEYENFRIAIDKSFDLIFSGRVGFNDSLSMSVSMPIHESLLRKLGASGPLGDYARLLRNVRVTIPLTGTRESPVLDFKRVKIDALVRQAGEALLREQAEKFLKR